MVEPVQRWRIAFRRGSPALDLGPPEIARAWETGLAAAGIPVVMSAAARPRPRLAFAAPLPPGRAAEHDLADLILGERWPLSRLRAALEAALPAGFDIVELYDVWLGAPAITAALGAMSHRATVAGAGPVELAAAADGLLAADRLERNRAKGTEREVVYDLRRLILELEVGGDERSQPRPDRESAVARASIRMALRTPSDGPPGRPDEVILALCEVIGRDLELLELVRERLWTTDEAAGLARSGKPREQRPPDPPEPPPTPDRAIL
jgi:radical SAM-linked protein